jgi:hypothetical protein
MREQEMRMRVMRFLSVRMRNMIMPATVGIGLAMGGACGKSAPAKDGLPLSGDAAALKQDAPAGQDVAGRDLVLEADVLGPDLPQPGRDVQSGGDLVADTLPDAMASADKPSTGDEVGKRDAADRDERIPDATPPIDTGSDLSETGDIAHSPDAALADSAADLGEMKDMAASPDAAPASTDSDVGTITTKYIAQLPDAAVDSTPVVRYMAQQPDAASERTPVAVYLAQMPRGV